MLPLQTDSTNNKSIMDCGDESETLSVVVLVPVVVPVVSLLYRPKSCQEVANIVTPTVSSS